MKLVTSEQMREIDRRTITEFGIPGEVLMERAGSGVAEIVQRLMRMSGCVNPSVQLFAGIGNNGGDAFVAARCLREQGLDIEVCVAGEVDAISGDALKHLTRAKSAGITFYELPMKEDWDNALVSHRDCGDILVDGVLGTGTRQGIRPHTGMPRMQNELLC